MSASFDDANEFLLAAGVPSAKFETPGTTVSGKIAHRPELQQQREIESGKPKFWDDGKPRQQIVVHLQTADRNADDPDDDGIRALYVRGNMLKAVREAVRKAGARLEIGGELTVTYTGDGEQKNRAFNPPKLYSVRYVGPAQAAVADVLGEPATPVATITSLPTAGGPERPAAIAPATWDTLTPDQRAALVKLHDEPPF